MADSPSAQLPAKGRIPRHRGGANTMASVQPSIWGISWFGKSSCAPAGGPYPLHSWGEGVRSCLEGEVPRHSTSCSWQGVEAALTCQPMDPFPASSTITV